MNVYIDSEGKLHIKAESPTENYALKTWIQREYINDKNRINGPDRKVFDMDNSFVFEYFDDNHKT